MTESMSEQEISRLRNRLAELVAERLSVERRLAELARPPAPLATACGASNVTNAFAAAEKIVLFRRLFAGREDVFPVRWENSKSERSGYAPACANEWVRGVCGKPQVKCGECPNQAFIPVSDAVIENHLRGEDHSRSGDFVNEELLPFDD